MTIGLALFAAAILGDICRLRPPAGALARWTLPLVAVALVAALCWMGRGDWRIPGTRFDWGSVAIVAAFAIGMTAWSGLRVAAVVSLLFGLLALAFWASRGSSMLWLGLLLGASLLLLLLIGVRVAFAMGLVGLLGLYFLLPMTQLPVLADRAWTSINNFTLTAVPSFVLMGALLVRSGITSDLFDALVCWFGRTRGGLAHSSVAAAATFAAVCGSSLATAATLGPSPRPRWCGAATARG